MNDNRPEPDSRSIEEATFSNNWYIAAIVEVFDLVRLLPTRKG